MARIMHCASMNAAALALALAAVLVVVGHVTEFLTSEGREDARRLALEEVPPRAGGARARYRKAEEVIRASLSMAHRYERKAAVQRKLENKDENLHYELVKAARNQADSVRRQDRKLSKVSDARLRMEDALHSTSSVLALHQKRLEDLMGEQRTDTVKVKRLQEDVDSLKQSAKDMGADVKRLEGQAVGMKKRFAREEHDTGMTRTSKVLEKMLDLFSSRHAAEASHAQRAKDRAAHARSVAHNKQGEALLLQSRADSVAKELASMGCSSEDTGKGKGEGKAKDVDGEKCDPGKRVSLEDEASSLHRQIKVLEQEVLFQHKQARVMDATARLQEKMAATDAYKAREYRIKVQDAQHGLEALRTDLQTAPHEIEAAELNLKLAEQAAARVRMRLRLMRDKRKTEFAEVSKAKALAALQEREIRKIKGLMHSQETAMETAAKAERAEGSILSAQSSSVQRTLAESRAVEEDALQRSEVAQRWASAATMKMKEAAAYAKVASFQSAGHRWAHVAIDSSREASQMRHGLQLMAVESAIRRFQRDPSRGNRRELERLEGLLEDRLGRADDANENAASIRELNTIEDELDGIDAASHSVPGWQAVTSSSGAQRDTSSAGREVASTYDGGGAPRELIEGARLAEEEGRGGRGRTGVGVRGHGGWGVRSDEDGEEGRGDGSRHKGSEGKGEGPRGYAHIREGTVGRANGGRGRGER